MPGITIDSEWEPAEPLMLSALATALLQLLASESGDLRSFSRTYSMTKDELYAAVDELVSHNYATMDHQQMLEITQLGRERLIH